MVNNMSQLVPYLWVVAAIVLFIVAFVIVRFFWKHVLKYVVQGCLGIVVILFILAVLHYYFKLF